MCYGFDGRPNALSTSAVPSGPTGAWSLEVGCPWNAEQPGVRWYFDRVASSGFKHSHQFQINISDSLVQNVFFLLLLPGGDWGGEVWRLTGNASEGEQHTRVRERQHHSVPCWKASRSQYADEASSCYHFTGSGYSTTVRNWRYALATLPRRGAYKSCCADSQTDRRTGRSLLVFMRARPKRICKKSFIIGARA